MNFRMHLRRLGIILLLAIVAVMIGSAPTHAEIFGSVHGVVHDPQHRPIPSATVDLKAKNSEWVQHQISDDNGEFDFSAVPLGEYTVTVTVANFQTEAQSIIVASGTSSVLHFQLALATVSEKTVVTGEPVSATLDSVTPTTLLAGRISRRLPGPAAQTAWPSSRTTFPARTSLTINSIFAAATR